MGTGRTILALLSLLAFLAAGFGLLVTPSAPAKFAILALMLILAVVFFLLAFGSKRG